GGARSGLAGREVRVVFAGPAPQSALPERGERKPPAVGEAPGKVTPGLRTAPLPRLADVMTFCDELESQLSTVASTKPAAVVSTKAVVSSKCSVCAARREAKHRAMAKWRKSRLTPSPSRQAYAQAREPPTPPTATHSTPPRASSTALATGRPSAHHQPPPSSPPGPPAPVTGHCTPLSATPPASPSWAIASKGSNEGGCQPRACAGAT